MEMIASFIEKERERDGKRERERQTERERERTRAREMTACIYVFQGKNSSIYVSY